MPQEPMRVEPLEYDTGRRPTLRYLLRTVGVLCIVVSVERVISTGLLLNQMLTVGGLRLRGLPGPGAKMIATSPYSDWLYVAISGLFAGLELAAGVLLLMRVLRGRKLLLVWAWSSLAWPVVSFFMLHGNDLLQARLFAGNPIFLRNMGFYFYSLYVSLALTAALPVLLIVMLPRPEFRELFADSGRHD